MEIMNSNERQQKTYKKIAFEMRQTLIKYVIQQKISIANAAKKLQINSSTAKMILKKYRETGQIFQKKEERMKRIIIEKQRKRIQEENIATTMINSQSIYLMYTLNPFYGLYL